MKRSILTISEKNEIKEFYAKNKNTTQESLAKKFSDKF